jgi:nicotinate-nucleotide pyrophosphorylase (carboxylating)
MMHTTGTKTHEGKTMSTFTAGETAACCRLIEMALPEDFGTSPWWQFRDPTTAWCIPPGYGVGAAAFVARSPGIIAGLPAVELVCGAVDPELRFETIFQDGEKANPGSVLAHVRGSMYAILGAERVALNFLQHLSGIASLTNQYIEAIAGLPVKILDTRKTIPGWRSLAKYAVRHGGGHNHRMGLYDGILIKDNHLNYAASCGKGKDYLKYGIGDILRRARRELDLPIEIEVESLVQLDEALPAKPDIVLLDNMPLEMMREAVKRRNHVAPGVLLEASGGVALQTVRAIAETGVDRISVGALTHSAPALDIALDYQHGR